MGWQGGSVNRPEQYGISNEDRGAAVFPHLGMGKKCGTFDLEL